MSPSERQRVTATSLRIWCIRREDVIEELYLDDRLQTADRHADRTPDDVCLGERRIENASSAKFSLQVRRHLEHAAFAFDAFEIFFTRAIGHVLAKDDDTRVAFHLFVHAAVDEIDHRAGVAGEFGTVFGIEQLTVGRIDIGREHVSECRFGCGLRRFDRDVGGLVDFVIDLFAQRFEMLRDDAMPSVIRNSAYVLIGSIAASASRSSSGR